jgi:hypothetical protein
MSKLPGIEEPDWWLNGAGIWLPSTLHPLRGSTSGPAIQLVVYQGGLAIAAKRSDTFEMAAYATATALGLEPSAFEELEARVSGLPRESCLVILSEVLARLWRIGHDPRRHLDLAQAFFGPTPALERLIRFVVAGPSRVVFSEQGLVALQRLLLLHGQDGPVRELTDDELISLRWAVLAVADLIGPGEDELPSATPRDWLAYLTQNMAFNARDNIGNALARTWAIYVELADELGPTDVPTYAPINDWMTDRFGLDARRQLAIGFLLYAHTAIDDQEQASKGVVNPALIEDAANRMELTAAEANAACDLLVAPAAWYREQFQTSTSAAFSWGLVPMAQRPFLRLSNDALLLLSPRALHSWLTSGVHYRLLDAAKAKAGKKGVSTFTAYAGHLVERYVLDLVRSAHPEPRLPAAGKVYGERKYGNGAATSDVIVSYPTEMVLLEVSSPRLSTKTLVGGDQNAVRDELWRIVGGRIGQLRRVIEALKPAERTQKPKAEIEGLDGTKTARFRPVVVTVAQLGLHPPLDDFLTEVQPQTLQRPDIEPLEILDLEDLEALIGMVEGGITLAELLRRKQRAVGNGTAVAGWLQTDPTSPRWKRPEYLNDALDRLLLTIGGNFGIDAERLSEEIERARHEAAS